MKKASEYREHARECRQLAALMAEPANRQQLLRMADSWDLLADERERLLRLEDAASFDAV